MYTNLKMIFVIFVFFNAYNESHPHPQTPAEGLFKTLLRKIFENNLWLVWENLLIFQTAQVQHFCSCYG